MASMLLPVSFACESGLNSRNGILMQSFSQAIKLRISGASQPQFYTLCMKNKLTVSDCSLLNCRHHKSPTPTAGSTCNPSSRSHIYKTWAEASSSDFVSTSETKNQDGFPIVLCTRRVWLTATVTTFHTPNGLTVSETFNVGLGDSNGSFRDSVAFGNGSINESKKELSPSLSITILGATGELARQKIFPALFALFYSGCLPKKFQIFGYSSDQISDEDLQALVKENLTCRIDHQENCSDKIGSFLEKVSYESGGYDVCDGLITLDKRMKTFEGNGIANRIFYLSVAHDVIHEVASCVAANAQSKRGFTRLIFEKPFGYDRGSSAEITKAILSRLSEGQIYRIDDLLGKELIENLTVLRFSNLIFEPLWNRTFIRSIQVIYSEDWGVQNKGRYFDKHGILRDIVQSHILQTIALLAMEPPVSLEGEDIRNEKVKVLRSMRKLTLDDVVLGQYKASISKDGKFKVAGYLDEPDVSPNSLTPTFVAAVLYIDNGRWDGVPFLIKAGKGLIKHKVEIRIQFRHVPGNLYRDRFGFNIDLATNELVLRVHPDEAILLKVNNKVPGLGLQLDSSELNLLYKDKYDTEIPDSYERLILDVIDGDTHLFMRSDELAATWEILTPLLDDIEKYKIAPELYMFGGRGPVGAYYLGAKHGVRWSDE